MYVMHKIKAATMVASCYIIATTWVGMSGMLDVFVAVYVATYMTTDSRSEGLAIYQASHKSMLI